MKLQNLKKRITAVIASVVLASVIIPAGTIWAYSTGTPNTWTNTGKQQTDIVEIARSQVGYTETSSNHTKYAAWFYGSDKSIAWCGIFISWCANQAGIPTSVIAKSGIASGYSTSNMASNSYKVPTYAFGTTQAKPGDIIYVDNTGNNVSNHVGLVVSTDDTYIYTVEGNSSDKVANVRYRKSDGKRQNGTTASTAHIIFYGRPDYQVTAAPKTPAAPAVSAEKTAETKPAATTAASLGKYMITASSLNVRSTYNTSGSVLGVLAKGAVVEINKVTNGWGAFSYKGSTGWISLNYAEKTAAAVTVESSAPAAGTTSGTASGSTATAASADTTSYKTGTYTVDTTCLTVRSGPDTTYSALGTLSNGTKITVSKTEGRFGCFQYNGKTAWTSLKYCKLVSEATTSGTASGTTSGTTSGTASGTTSGSAAAAGTTYTTGTYVTTGSVNVRSGPETTYACLGTLKAGTTVKVTKTEGRFGLFQYNGKAGWVSLKYCTKQ